MDESLSFLDAFVQDAIRKGAPQYSPPDDKDDDCACSTPPPPPVAEAAEGLTTCARCGVVRQTRPAGTARTWGRLSSSRPTPSQSHTFPPPHTHTLVVVPLTPLLPFIMVLSGPRSLPLPWWPPLPLLALGPWSLG